MVSDFSVIGGFRSVLCFCVSRFVACDRNYDRTAAKNAIVKAAFELKSSHVCEKRSKTTDVCFTGCGCVCLYCLVF